jgi:hypothetical protein
VKWALDPVCDDTAAVRKAGTEMLTMRIEHLDVTAELSKDDEIPPEVVHGLHVGNCDVGAPRDLKPSGWSHARQCRRPHAHVLSRTAALRQITDFRHLCRKQAFSPTTTPRTLT